jgi:hypothetical protein
VVEGDVMLKPGMTATTKIVTAERDNVIRVPDQALRYTPARGRCDRRHHLRPGGASLAVVIDFHQPPLGG